VGASCFTKKAKKHARLSRGVTALFVRGKRSAKGSPKMTLRHGVDCAHIAMRDVVETVRGTPKMKTQQ
jgi:hypothetical protein